MANLRVRHLAAAEENRCLHLVAIFDEALDVVLLELVIVLVHLRTELDFLDLDHLLVALRFPGPLLLLVLILAVVHDSTDGRHGGRRDFDQVEAFLAGKDKSLGRRHDAQLLPRVVDYADFTNPDALVDAQPVVTTGRARSIECDTLPPATKITRIAP